MQSHGLLTRVTCYVQAALPGPVGIVITEISICDEVWIESRVLIKLMYKVLRNSNFIRTFHTLNKKLLNPENKQYVQKNITIQPKLSICA